MARVCRGQPTFLTQALGREAEAELHHSDARALRAERVDLTRSTLCILLPLALVLAGSSQALCASSSAADNNGSAFAGLSANTPYYNTAVGIAMWVARFWLMVPVLAIAGSLAAKRNVAPSSCLCNIRRATGDQWINTTSVPPVQHKIFTRP